MSPASRLARSLLLCVALCVSTERAGAQVISTGTDYLFPLDGVEVQTRQGSLCAVRVRAVENRTYWKKKPPPGEFKLRPGTERRSEEGTALVRKVVEAVERLFLSKDGQKKAEGACDRLGTNYIEIYVADGDPEGLGPGAYVYKTNVIVVDLGLIEKLSGQIETSGAPRLEAFEAAKQKLIATLLLSILAHEFDHAWRGTRDPRAFNEKGTAVEDENTVLAELGVTNLTRDGYLSVDSSGYEYQPYTVDGIDLRIMRGIRKEKRDDQQDAGHYCCSADEYDDRSLDALPEVGTEEDLDRAAALDWLAEDPLDIMPPFGPPMGPDGDASSDGWTLGLTGGFSTITNPTGGTAGSLPGVLPFIAINGNPTVSTVSWFLGDSTVHFNKVMAAHNKPQTIVPLDPVLVGPSFEMGGGIDIGALICHPVSEQIKACGDIRFWTPSHDITSEARARVEATSASAQAAWSSLIATAPNAAATSTATFEAGGGGLMSIGGLLEFQVGRRAYAGWRPSLRVGAGITSHFGSEPSATVISDHRFSVGPATIHETDTVTIDAETYRAFAVQFGAAARRRLNSRVNVVIEGMVDAYRHKVAIDLSATPSRVTGTPAITAAFSTMPTIQFNNSTGQSSLSGSAADVTTFRGAGTGFAIRFGAGLEFGL